VNLSMAFTGLWRNVTLIEYGPDQINKGERVRGTPAEFIVQLVVLRITPTQLRSLPEGQYKAGDLQIYGKTTADLREGLYLTYNGNRYRIDQIADRGFEGGYVKAYAKREL
jgi:hypothetical protein